MALALVVCGLAGAADKIDPVGTWKCEYEIDGQKRTSTLTIKKDGDKLAGTMSWPDQKETNLKALKLKDDTLTFSAVRKFMDNEITVEYKLTLDGDKLKRKGGAEFGGQKQEGDLVKFPPFREAGPPSGTAGKVGNRPAAAPAFAVIP